MRTKLSNKTAFLPVLFLLPFVNVVAYAETNSVSQALSVTDASVGYKWGKFGAWGKESDGIIGGVHVWCGELPKADIVVDVIRPGEPLIITKRYWGATNFCCGPIELQDTDGNKIPLLKPNINSPESYPASFSMTNLISQMPKYSIEIYIQPPPGFHESDFLRERNRPYQIDSFKLEDYFKPKKVGEYKLTVWPKIYKQSEMNQDLYQRIDVPPVTVAIRWYPAH